jgi:hypothetical protein
MQVTVGPVVWSPDEQALAFFMTSDKLTTIEVLTVSESVSHTVAEVSLTEEDFTFPWLFNMLSWMP